MIQLSKQEYEMIAKQRLSDLRKIEAPCALTHETIKLHERMLSSKAVAFSAPEIIRLDRPRAFFVKGKIK